MHIKKIMLIRPGVRFPKTLFCYPLGCLYLTSVLRQNFPGQFEIDLVEQSLYNLNFKKVRGRIKEFAPDLIGFSCLSVEADEMSQISKIAKEINPKGITVLGGPHASVFYDHALDNANIDIVVIGEGEKTFPELLKKLMADEPIDNVKGIAFKKDGKIILTPPREPIEDLDNIPFPAWDMVDFKRYSREMSMNVYCHSTPWAAIFTSRGCPYHCAYCHNIFGKRIRFRSPENVVEEIELLTKKYRVKEIQIVDDIFNLDLNRAKRICDLIIERKIKVKIAFPNGLRGDMMDKELIHKLKQAGCYSITYAVETASPRLQKLIQKNLNLDKVSHIIEWTSKAGIALIRGFFMIGFPSETMEEMKMTLNYALKNKFLEARFHSVAIYPRTSLMEIAKKVYPNFDFNKWEFGGLFYWAEIPFYTRVTGIDLSKIQVRIHLRFYLRPKIIFSLLRHLPKNISSIKLHWFNLRPRFIRGSVILKLMRYLKWKLKK